MSEKLSSWIYILEAQINQTTNTTSRHCWLAKIMMRFARKYSFENSGEKHFQPFKIPIKQNHEVFPRRIIVVVVVNCYFWMRHFPAPFWSFASNPFVNCMLSAHTHTKCPCFFVFCFAVCIALRPCVTRPSMTFRDVFLRGKISAQHQIQADRLTSFAKQKAKNCKRFSPSMSYKFD